MIGEIVMSLYSRCSLKQHRQLLIPNVGDASQVDSPTTEVASPESVTTPLDEVRPVQKKERKEPLVRVNVQLPYVGVTVFQVTICALIRYKLCYVCFSVRPHREDHSIREDGRSAFVGQTSGVSVLRGSVGVHCNDDCGA